MPDSASLALPPARPLKRSASTASLPTPPRTQRKRRYGKSRRSHASSSEEEDSDASVGRASPLVDSDEEEQSLNVTSKYKKRRLSKLPEKEDEEAFWTGVSRKMRSKTISASASNKGRSQSASELDADTQHSDSASESESSFLSRRRHNKSTTGSAPVSPPPSHRRPPAAKIATAKVAADAHTLPVLSEEPENEGASPKPASVVGSSPPETPKSSKLAAMMDSPNNPFLASPLDINESDSEPRTTAPMREKPTISYVFRGVKKTYPNPYYDHDNKRPLSPNPKSLLPPEHPDFTPDLRGVARALWPASRKRKGKAVSVPTPASPNSPTGATSGARRRGKQSNRGKTLLDSDDEDNTQTNDIEEEDDFPVHVRPLKLFAPGVTARS